MMTPWVNKLAAKVNEGGACDCYLPEVLEMAMDIGFGKCL
jgi:hypothetical protein